MFKLKSKFIIASLVIFGVLFSITACNKDEITESTETNSESIIEAYNTYANQSVEQYLTSNTKLSWIDWIAIGIADATGACEGAKLAAPLLPPWGSIGGGLIVGAAASYTTYIGLGGTPQLHHHHQVIIAILIMHMNMQVFVIIWLSGNV